MFEIVLVAPEIPPNTGNVIRLAANTGCRLHLVEPLGFDLSEPQLRRAGLDYHDLTVLTVHPDWAHCAAALAGRRFFAFSTQGKGRFETACFASGDVLVFGSETAGLDPALRASFPPQQVLRLPMCAGNRSLNLSNTVAVVVFEAWRQNGYLGSTTT